MIVVGRALFRCSVCGEEFDSFRMADEVCGSLSLEEPKFSVGNQVMLRSGAVLYVMACETVLPKSMAIAACIGPVYGRLTTVSGERSNAFGHVYQYEVRYSCRKHGGECSHLFFGYELRHISKRKKCIE